MSEVQRADPRTRRKTIIYVFVMFAVFVPTLYSSCLQTESIEAWIAAPGKTIERAKLILTILIAVGAILLFMNAALAFRFASAILRSDRYPPPNVNLIKDTVIRRCVSARKTGHLMQALGIALLFFLITMILVGWTLIREIDQMAS